MVNIFYVHCERIGRRAYYKLWFTYNEQLVEKITNLNKKERSFNDKDKTWELSVGALYSLMKQYKGSDKIFFSFGDDKNKDIFVKLLQHLKEKEKEKRELIKDLNVKKKIWLKKKKEFDENFQKYSEIVHKNLKNIKLYPYQIGGVMYLNEVRNALLSLDMGLGKAQPLDSKILTDNGWVLMKDIKIGSRVVGSDGKFKKVLNIFPQGVSKIYEIVFNDGSIVESTEDHLWMVNTPLRISRTLRGKGVYPYKLKTLKEIIDEGLYCNSNNRKHFIPIVKPIEFEKKDLELDPYVLGCLLGNGGLTIKYCVNFSTGDQEIIDILNKRLFKNHFLKKKKNSKYDYSIISQNQKENRVCRLIKSNGLTGHSSHTKFIPDKYKYSSIKQRLELLQGLLDTDGHAMKDGGIELTLASKKLILDTQFIVESLGGIARFSIKNIIYNNEKRKYYKLNIKLPPDIIPFKIKRKKDNYKKPSKYPPNRGISEINYVGEKEAQCILIDSDDHLYCTNHCILTHNTIVSISYSEMNKFDKVFVITPNSLKFNYYNEIDKFTNSKAHIIGWKNNPYTIEESRYIITNYEYFNSSDKKKVNKKIKDLKFGKINCLILDESHRIKSSSSNTYLNIKRIFNKKRFFNNKISKIFMSGTPAPSRAGELYTILNMISPLDFPTKENFLSYYCGMRYDIDEGTWIINNDQKKLEELFHKLSPYTYRKKKYDVLKDLPEKTYQKIVLEMSDKEQDIYNQIEEGVANEFINKNIENPLAIMGKLKEYTSYLKVKYIKDIIDSIINSGEKFIVVDYYKKSLYEIKNLYPNISELHTGDQKVEDKANTVKRFQDVNSDLLLFLGSEGSTKEGLTLTAASKIGVLTLPWTPTILDQITDRVCRIGQKNAVNAFLFVFKNTIDEIIFNLLEDKRVDITKVLDNEDYDSNIKVSIFDDVVSKIKEKYKNIV